MIFASAVPISIFLIVIDQVGELMDVFVLKEVMKESERVYMFNVSVQQRARRTWKIVLMH
jgi:hypothetical protein